MLPLGFAGRELHISISAPKVDLPVLGETSISLIVTCCITLALVLLCLFINSRVKKFTDTPGKFQLVMEMIVSGVDNFAENKVGKKASKEMIPYIASIGSLILFGCLIELFGFRPVPGDFNMPIALALMSFFLINYLTIKYKGIKYRLKSYVKPMAFVAPFKVISDLAAPVSLACRLFGNVLAGMIVMELIYFAMGNFAIGVPAALSVYFTIFHAGIQTYIFCMLSLSYVQEAMEALEED